MAAARRSASAGKRVVKKKVVKKAVAKKPAVKKKTTTTKTARPKVTITPPPAEIADDIVASPSPKSARKTSSRPRKRTAVDRLDDPPPATGLALITRVTSAIERELNKIEVIVGGHRIRPTERTEGERRARTLASLARTLSEVARLRAQHQQKADDDDDDTVPRDLDDLRETLARRLEKLLADPTQPPDCEPEPA